MQDKDTTCTSGKLKLFYNESVTRKREPNVYFISKGEYLGEYYEKKPFYSSVLTEEEVAEIEKDMPDIRSRLIKVVELIK